MDYARQQRDPGRHAIGIAFVVIVHALVIYALMTGLARHAIEVIKKPLNATIIEELKLPPPPPPPPPKPAIRRGIVPTYKEEIVFPRAAIRAGIDRGTVVARVMIDEKGNVTDVIIVSADPPRHFDRAVQDALRQWKFAADGEKYVGEIEVSFKLN